MTETDICNRALALLGHDRPIEDFDGMTDGAYNDQSTEAVRCRAFYGAAVRNCLAEHDWDFAAEERPVGTTSPDPYGWVRLPLPDGAIRVVAVRDEEGRPFRTERNARFIRARTFGRGGSIRYVADSVKASEMPHKFAEAVIAQLAFLLAGPMFGDDGRTNSFYQLAQNRLSDAVTKETDETAYRGEPDNPFIRARR